MKVLNIGNNIYYFIGGVWHKKRVGTQCSLLIVDDKSETRRLNKLYAASKL